MNMKKHLLLSGITRHGKNRIHQHGETWEVIAEGNVGARLNVFHLKSLEKTEGPVGEKGRDERTIFLSDDPNFKIKINMVALSIEEVQIVTIVDSLTLIIGLKGREMGKR